MTDVKQYKITLVKSPIGRLKSHKACLLGLGLRNLHQTVTVIATPSNMGMVNKVNDMLKIEELV